MLAVVAVVRRLELDLVVVFLRRFIGFALAREALDDPFGLRGLGRVRVGVYEVDDLRGERRSRGGLAAST